MRILLPLLLLSTLSYGQERYHESKVVCPNDTITYLRFDMKPLNGIVYSAAGDLGKYVDGKKVGIHRSWHSDGQLSSEENWKDGKEDGLHRWWYDNGQLSWEGNYKDGKREGLYRRWYENGQLSWEGNYKDGKAIYYNEDGVVYKTEHYEDGELVHCEGDCD